MEKTVKVNEIMGLGTFLGTNEDVLEGVKLNAKSLYGILKLKKTILERFGTAQETLIALAKNYGATPTEEGQGMQVPPDRLEDFNKDYIDLMNEDVVLPYEMIEIPATAECSTKFMEAFFDFILITD